MSKVVRIENRESSKAVRSYRDLLVWQKSMDFVTAIYDVTRRFPKEEMYGLTQQVRRAAISVPSNIAEGSSRRSTQEFLRFINIATGSLAEVETQILLAEKLSYLTNNDSAVLLHQADEISRMLQGLYHSLESKKSRLSTPDSNH